MGSKSRFWRSRRNDAFFALIVVLRWLAIAMPRGAGLWLFARVGWLLSFAVAREHRRALDHLRLIYGERWSEGRIRDTAREVFANVGRTLFDAVRIPRMGDAELARVVEAHGFDTLLAWHRKGKGPITITGHMGCFEMLLPLGVRWGINGFAVGQRLFDPRLDALVARSRSGTNMEYVARDANPREVIRRLQRGLAFGVLIDQDTSVESVFAHFLGKLAYTPSGAVRLALRYEIPLFVLTTRRVEGNRHRIDVHGPLALPAGSTEQERLVRSVELVNSLLSAAIEQAPEQWVWMHRRWHRQPSNPAYAAVPSIEQYPPSH